MIPLSEQEEFEFRLRAEREAQSQTMQPEQPKENYPGEDIVKSAIGPIYEPAKAIAKGYGAIKESITEPISKMMPSGGPKFPMSSPNPMFPATQIPLGKMTGRESLKELAGLGVDQLATMGVARGVPTFVKGADKLATSTFRRIGGLTSGDIKSTRALTSEFGPEFVFNKTKAKPEYVGREILPKASKAIKGSIKSMEPSALKEAGVPEKSVKFSQKVKGLTSIKTLPSKDEADKFFQKTIESLPDDIDIEPEYFKKALSGSIAEIESGLGPNHPVTKSMKFMLSNLETPPSGTETIERGLSPITRNLNKERYIATRRDINRMFGGSDEFNRFIQPLKEAIDKDASVAAIEKGVSAPMGLARTQYRLPRELQKAETYINKPNFDEALENELRQAANPEKVSLRNTLKGLAGKESDSILKDLEAQRLSKEYYGGGETSGINLGRNTAYEAFKNLARKIPRTYEEGRANLFSALKGNKK